jgi:hypothetical protein
MENEKVEQPNEVPFFARFLEDQRREGEDGTKAERTTKYPSDNDEFDWGPWF